MSLAACKCGGTRSLAKRRTLSGGVEIVAVCAKCRNLEALGRREVAELRDADLVGLRFVTKPAKKQPNSKRRAYNAYLQSPDWKRKREEVLARDNFECRIGLEECTEEATEVDHVAYAEVLASVPLEQLRACCRNCNLEAKQRRIAFGSDDRLLSGRRA